MLAATMNSVMQAQQVVAALDRARACSPFLAMVLDREPAIEMALSAGRIDLSASSADPAMPVARRLRLERRALALNVAVGDLAGVLDLTAVTAALSGFADRALDTAIRAAIEERTPGSEPLGAGQLRAQLFVGHRPHPVVRSHDAAAPPARGTGGGGGSDRQAGRRAAAAS
jgi:glutamine synthetase adenylyltransferase